MKKDIQEKINIRENFIRANIEFIHNYTGSMLLKQKIERFSIVKLAIEIEKKQGELFELKEVLKLMKSEV